MTRSSSFRRRHPPVDRTEVFPLLHHARSEVGLDLQEAELPSVSSLEREATQVKTLGKRVLRHS